MKALEEKKVMPLSTDGDGGNSAKELDIESMDQRDYGSAFCLATCYLVIANYYHPEEGLTMKRLQKENIVKSNGEVTRWGDYVSRGDTIDFDKSKIITALAQDKPVILRGKIRNSTFPQHFVVAYGYAGNEIKIMDPWGGEKGVLGYTDFINYTNNYFRICTE